MECDLCNSTGASLSLVYQNTSVFQLDLELSVQERKWKCWSKPKTTQAQQTIKPEQHSISEYGAKAIPQATLESNLSVDLITIYFRRYLMQKDLTDWGKRECSLPKEEFWQLGARTCMFLAPKARYFNQLTSVIRSLRIYLQFFPWPPHSRGFLWFDLIKSNTFRRHGYIFETGFLNSFAAYIIYIFLTEEKGSAYVLF